MCLLVGQGNIIGALLCTPNFLHARHYTVQNTQFSHFRSWMSIILCMCSILVANEFIGRQMTQEGHPSSLSSSSSPLIALLGYCAPPSSPPADEPEAVQLTGEYSLPKMGAVSHCGRPCASHAVLATIVNHKCSQNCCPGGSQACSQACSWRALSSGPCQACVALQSQILAKKWYTESEHASQQAVFGSFCGSHALVFGCLALCDRSAVFPWGGGGGVNWVNWTMFPWRRQVQGRYEIPHSHCKLAAPYTASRRCPIRAHVAMLHQTPHERFIVRHLPWNVLPCARHSKNSVRLDGF